MVNRTPAEVFPPGLFLKEEIDARGWTQVELAEVLGRPARVVSEIILGKRGITPETAKGLSAAFGTSAEYWMNLETSYQLTKTNNVEQDIVARRSCLYGKFPVKELIKRGWVEFSENIDVLENNLLSFFEISSPDEKPTFAYAGKKRDYANDSIIQTTWLKRASQISRAVQAGKFSDNKLPALLTELKAMLEYADSIREIPALLAKYGIRLVIIEALPKLEMNGACFWLSPNEPVIALTLAYDRIDNFWFVLMHELDHIAHGEGKGTPIIDNLAPEQQSSNLPEFEKRACDNAASSLIPPEELQSFIVRVNPIFSHAQIVGFAKRLRVHPGIVVGQLQNRKIIHWSHHRKTLESVRDKIIGGVLTDGFGYKLQV